jgi:hypothetical protein
MPATAVGGMRLRFTRPTAHSPHALAMTHQSLMPNVVHGKVVAAPRNDPTHAGENARLELFHF